MVSDSKYHDELLDILLPVLGLRHSAPAGNIMTQHKTHEKMIHFFGNLEIYSYQCDKAFLDAPGLHSYLKTRSL